MGFYSDGVIHHTVAKILDQRTDPITFDYPTMSALKAGDHVDQRIANAIEISLQRGIRIEGQPYRVFVLSQGGDEETVSLPVEITNASKSKSGGTSAWTQNQRYTRLSALRKPGITTTKELEEAGG
jgi:hypothetical protein